MSRMAETFPRRVCEWASAATVLMLGVALLGARIAGAFEAGLPDSEAYLAALARLLPLEVAGLGMVCLASVRLGALAINGAWRPTPHMRAVTASLSGLIYLQLLFGVVGAQGPLIALAVLPSLIGSELYVAFRAAGEARMADEAARMRRLLNGASA